MTGDAKLLRILSDAARKEMRNERGYSTWLLIRTSDWFACAVTIAVIAAVVTPAWFLH